jgi:hypothetical protein
MTGVSTAMAAACDVLSARFDKYDRDSIMIEFPFSGNEF